MDAINQIINVNSFYFPGGSVRRALPRTMEFGSIRCTFVDGLQYLVRKGSSIIKLFDMSDGYSTYRLRLEGDQWTLVRISRLAIGSGMQLDERKLPGRARHNHSYVERDMEVYSRSGVGWGGGKVRNACPVKVTPEA